MSLQTRLVALAQAIGADIKTLSESIPTGGPTTTLDGGSTPDEAYTGEVLVLEGTAVPSLIQAKGDLLGGSGVGTISRLPIGDTTGQVLKVDPASSIGMSWGSFGGPSVDLSTDYSSTTPSTPSSGLTVFSRSRARRLIASIGSSGQDTAYQPSLFSNRVARLTVVNNVAAPVLDGMATGAYAGSPIAVAPVSTSFYAGMVRNRYSTTSTAGTVGGIRSNTTQWFLSSTANLGGFFFVCRFGLAAITTTNRVFVGMRTASASTTSATETAIANSTQPSALTNMIGIGCDSADTTLQFMCNDASGTATKVNLGANFPCQTAATWFYEVRLFAPSGNGADVRYSITRLNDGQYAEGQATTDLPALGTMLAAHVIHSNGTTSSIASLDLQSLYIESDN